MADEVTFRLCLHSLHGGLRVVAELELSPEDAADINRALVTTLYRLRPKTPKSEAPAQ